MVELTGPEWLCCEQVGAPDLTSGFRRFRNDVGRDGNASRLCVADGV